MPTTRWTSPAPAALATVLALGGVCLGGIEEAAARVGQSTRVDVTLSGTSGLRGGIELVLPERGCARGARHTAGARLEVRVCRQGPSPDTFAVDVTHEAGRGASFSRRRMSVEARLSAGGSLVLGRWRQGDEETQLHARVAR